MAFSSVENHMCVQKCLCVHATGIVSVKNGRARVSLGL